MFKWNSSHHILQYHYSHYKEMFMSIQVFLKQSVTKFRYEDSLEQWLKLTICKFVLTWKLWMMFVCLVELKDHWHVLAQNSMTNT